MLPLSKFMKLLVAMITIVQSTSAENRWSSRTSVIDHRISSCENLLAFHTIGNGAVSCVSDQPVLMDVEFGIDVVTFFQEIPFTITFQRRACNFLNRVEPNGPIMFESVLQISPSLINNLQFTQIVNTFEIECRNAQKRTGVIVSIDMNGRRNEYEMQLSNTLTYGKNAPFDAWSFTSLSIPSQGCAPITLEWDASRNMFICEHDNKYTAAIFLECAGLQNCRSQAKSTWVHGMCNGIYKPRKCNEPHSDCPLRNLANLKTGGIVYCKAQRSVAYMPIFKYEESFNNGHSSSLWGIYNDDNDSQALKKFVRLELSSSENWDSLTFSCYAPKFLAIAGFTWTATNTRMSISTATGAKRYQDENFIGETYTIPRPNGCNQHCLFQMTCSIYFQNGKEYSATLNRCNHFTQKCGDHGPKPKSTTTIRPTTPTIPTTKISTKTHTRQYKNFQFWYATTPQTKSVNTASGHQINRVFINHAHSTNRTAPAFQFGATFNKAPDSKIPETYSTVIVPALQFGADFNNTSDLTNIESYSTTIVPVDEPGVSPFILGVIVGAGSSILLGSVVVTLVWIRFNPSGYRYTRY